MLFAQSGDIRLPYPKRDCTHAENIEQCSEVYYKTYAEKFGVKEALQALERDRERDVNLKRDCHDVAHQIGHVAAKEYQTMGEAFEAGVDICAHGYYHGVVEKRFEHEDIKALSATRVQGFCADTLVATSPLLHLNCVHGVGHALMYMSRGDIVTSLLRCGDLSTNTDRAECMTGVLMERPSSSATIKVLPMTPPSDPILLCSQSAGKSYTCWVRAAAITLLQMGGTKDDVPHLCSAFTSSEYQKACTSGT